MDSKTKALKQEKSLENSHPAKTRHQVEKTTSLQFSIEETLRRAQSNPSAHHPDQVLQLQRTIGNRATRKLLRRTSDAKIQRLPTKTDVEGQLGKAKKGRNYGVMKKEGSTLYRPVLNALDLYHSFIANKPINRDTLIELMDYYSGIEHSANEYVSAKGSNLVDKNNAKLTYMKQLVGMVQNERARAFGIASQVISARMTFVPKWANYLTQLSGSAPVVTDTQVTGQVGAGTNVLDVVDRGAGQLGYFKENIDVLPNMALIDAVKGGDVAGELAGTGLEGKSRTVLDNLEYQPAVAGITNMINAGGSQKNKENYALHGPFQKGGINLARRDVATSRLNQILGADVIVHAETAFRQTGQGNDLKEGVLMTAAKGVQPKDLTFGAQAAAGTVAIADPNMQRLLSRLQLLDALAFQIDRNLKNFFIHTNPVGQVIAVTGIDNDMSFGQYKTNLTVMGKFPGLSKYVDAQLARAILNLDPASLDICLADILSPAELDALRSRLAKLKAYLSGMQSRGELLEPNQWDQATAKGLFTEDTSYYAEMVKDYYPNGP